MPCTETFRIHPTFLGKRWVSHLMRRIILVPRWPEEIPGVKAYRRAQGYKSRHSE
ncbi:hypothetical protein Plhal304r1_c044g0125121 [Plasmopara halstedii]